MLRLVKADRSCIREHKRLYRSAFPINERFPWFLLVRKAIAGKAELLTIENDGKNAGFAYVISGHNLVYLFFFAVSKSLRGMGIGTEAIRQLIRTYADKILFLAIEPLEEGADNYAERVQRHGFYLSCGLKDLTCQISEAKMIYSVMSSAGEFPASEYESMMEAFFGKHIKKLLRIKMIKSV